jgi:hypothetical protein
MMPNGFNMKKLFLLSNLLTLLEITSTSHQKTQFKDKISLMYKSIILALLFSASINANEAYLQNEEIGLITVDKLKGMANLIEDVGHGTIIQDAQEKLKVDSIEGLTFRISVCDIKERHQLGYYQRGSRSTIKIAKNRLESIFLKNWDENTLKEIQDSYSYHFIEGEIFDSLIIQSWPTICLKPGLNLKNTTATLVHELIHFIGDAYDYPEYNQFESEDDYVLKILYKSGGEWDAYSKEVEFLKSYEQQNPSFFPTALILEFDDGNLENYILNQLGYADKFKLEFKNLLINEHNNALKTENYLGNLLMIYQNSLSVSEFNLEVTLNNRKVFQNNLKVYEQWLKFYQDNSDKLLETKTKITETQLELEQTYRDEESYKKDIDFYQNLVLLSNKDHEEQILKIEKLKHETSLLFGHAQ